MRIEMEDEGDWTSMMMEITPEEIAIMAKHPDSSSVILMHFKKLADNYVCGNLQLQADKD